MKYLLVLLLVPFFLATHSCKGPQSDKDSRSADTVASVKLRPDSVYAVQQAKKNILDSIRERDMLSLEQVKLHFKFDTAYTNGNYSFSSNWSYTLADSLFVVLINCHDGVSCTDQFLVVMDKFRLMEIDHLLVQISCDSDSHPDGRQLSFSTINDSTFSVEEQTFGKENIAGTKTVKQSKEWMISREGKIVSR